MRRYTGRWLWTIVVTYGIVLGVIYIATLYLSTLPDVTEVSLARTLRLEHSSFVISCYTASVITVALLPIVFICQGRKRNK